MMGVSYKSIDIRKLLDWQCFSVPYTIFVSVNFNKPESEIVHRLEDETQLRMCHDVSCFRRLTFHVRI